MRVYSSSRPVDANCINSLDYQRRSYSTCLALYGPLEPPVPVAHRLYPDERLHVWYVTEYTTYFYPLFSSLANAGLLAVHGVPHIPAPGEPSSVTWVVPSKAVGRAVIAMTYLFVASYAPTWGPVSWVYPPELFPTALRGKANSISTSANWIFNFALGVCMTLMGNILGEWRLTMIVLLDVYTFCLPKYSVEDVHPFRCL